MEDSPYNAKPSRIPPEEQTNCALASTAMIQRVLGYLVVHYGIPRHLCLLRGDVEAAVPARVAPNHAGNYEMTVES